MAKIVLNDGTERQVEWCGAASGVLSMEFAEPMEIYEAAVILIPENAEHITYHNGDETTVFDGYTHMFNARREDYSGHVTVSLRRAATT